MRAGQAALHAPTTTTMVWTTLRNPHTAKARSLSSLGSTQEGRVAGVSRQGYWDMKSSHKLSRWRDLPVVARAEESVGVAHVCHVRMQYSVLSACPHLHAWRVSGPQS